MRDMSSEELGDILKKVRKQKGFTQEEVAEKIHVARGVISEWESGKRNPGLLSIYKLCQFFDITLDELLGIEKQYITLTVSRDDIEKLHTKIENVEEAIAFIFPNQDTKLHHEWAELRRLFELLLLNAK